LDEIEAILKRNRRQKEMNAKQFLMKLEQKKQQAIATHLLEETKKHGETGQLKRLIETRRNVISQK
jgi:hypothetical protein